jgi:hypothetical protein
MLEPPDVVGVVTGDEVDEDGELGGDDELLEGRSSLRRLSLLRSLLLPESRPRSLPPKNRLRPRRSPSERDWSWHQARCGLPAGLAIPITYREAAAAINRRRRERDMHI